MALFKSSNPTLSEKMFNKSLEIDALEQNTMTVRGTMNKFGFMLLFVIGAASYPWSLISNYGPLKFDTVTTLMWVGLIGGLITGIAITIKKNWAKYIALLYAIFEGLLLGSLSAIINFQFAEKNPGMIIQAVGLTFAVAIAVFSLYNFRIITVTNKLRSIIISATLGVGIFYLIYWVLLLFGISMPFMNWNDASWLGIGINLLVIFIAAAQILVDLDMIENGAKMGAPKHMEWFGAFGLTITIVWLYIQILKLLSRLNSRD